MSSTIDTARDILATLAPEIPAGEITEEANLVEDLRLDPVTKFALAVQLERALKISIPDSRTEQAATIPDLVNDEN